MPGADMQALIQSRSAEVGARFARTRTLAFPMDLFPDTLKPEQLGPAALRPVANCFFAIRPDDAACARIVEAQREHCQRIGLAEQRWRPPGLFHLTIAEWGAGKRLREPLEAALRRAKQHFRYPAFDISLVSTARLSGGLDTFAFVLEADAATTEHASGLRIALADAQEPVGLVAVRGAFRPHVTIAYAPHLRDEAVPIQPIRFRASCVEMIVSIRGTRTHLVEDRWELA